MSSLARPSGRKRQRPSNDVDRLSKLPESVLCHILSLLPTKDAVATGLLSTRWKFFWTNIHNLSFSDDIPIRSNWGETKERNIKFAHFVNKVLIYLNQQTIDKFSLVITSSSCEVYDVSTWIAAAVSKNLKVLEFWVSNPDASESRFQLPCSLFTCQTLEVLDLFRVKNLNVPSMVCLPNLETLHLESVTYQSDESFRNFICGCSSLETMYIQRDVYDNVVNFTISSPTLRNLTFKFYRSESPDPEELDYNLCIDAPALIYLDLSDFLMSDFSVENLCLLDEAKVETINIKYMDIPLIDVDHYSNNIVVKLLQGVYNVKRLSMSGDILEALSHAGVSPSFPRLTRLAVKAEYDGWNSLLDLVKGSNKLEFLTFSKVSRSIWRGHKVWRRPEKVPRYLLTCLKTLSMRGFEGLEDELEMVAYILKNAKVLRTMTIETAYPLDLKAKFQLLQKVSKFHRGSEECEIIFS